MPTPARSAVPGQRLPTRPFVLAAGVLLLALTLRAAGSVEGALLVYLPVAVLGGALVALTAGSAVRLRAAWAALGIGVGLAAVGLTLLATPRVAPQAFPVWLLLAGGGTATVVLAARTLLVTVSGDEREGPPAAGDATD